MKFPNQLVIVFIVLFLGLACSTVSQKTITLDEGYIQHLDSVKHYITGPEREGYLQLVALLPLQPLSVNTLGKDSSNHLIINIEGVPEHLGAFVCAPDSLIFTASEGVTVTDIHGDTVTSRSFALDQYGNSDVFYYGTIKWMIKSFKDQRFLRVWDLGSERAGTFPGYEWYEPNEEFIFEAIYEPFAVPRIEEVYSSMGVNDEIAFEGMLHFNYRDVPYELLVQEGGFLMFADETSGDDTYGSGRYIELKVPNKRGKMTLDFNLAYNPPCAFSHLTTCRFAPKQNRLPFPVLAGEKIELSSSTRN